MKKYDSVRVFENPVLEACTHVHPIVPLLLWTPIIGYWLYDSHATYNLSVTEFGVLAVVGLLLWTLTEYVLHRFAFHYPAKNKFSRRLIYLFHGIHHDDPNDPTRLVMPPVPALIYVFFIYQFYALFFPSQYIQGFMAFFMVGYLFYDYIHYATHHFKMTSKVGRYLKKYHLVHHHAHEYAKFGVSNPLWDYVFKTVNGPKEESPWH